MKNKDHDKDELIVGFDVGDRRDRPLSGLAIGGTKAGQFLKSEYGEVLVVPILTMPSGPYQPMLNELTSTVIDRERYYWSPGLRGEFEIDFWIHEDIKTVRAALKEVFQIYADTYRE